jgi:glycerol-3-phosphate acyltransferase PlsY
VILIIGAYLLGSIPFGLIIARAHGKDLRSIGSGNIGATNLSRALGRKWAFLCFFLDVTKGLVPMLVATGFIVATSFGVALGLWPYYTVCSFFALGVWAVTVLMWRYVSLASIAASIAFPLALILVIVLTPGWDFADLWPLLAVATAIPLIVIVRHRENIKRLIAGTESKVFSK